MESIKLIKIRGILAMSIMCWHYDLLTQSVNAIKIPIHGLVNAQNVKCHYYWNFFTAVTLMHCEDCVFDLDLFPFCIHQILRDSLTLLAPLSFSHSSPLVSYDTTENFGILSTKTTLNKILFVLYNLLIGWDDIFMRQLV